MLLARGRKVSHGAWDSEKPQGGRSEKVLALVQTSLTLEACGGWLVPTITPLTTKETTSEANRTMAEKGCI